MPEEFSPEEKAAMEEMAQDNEPVTEEEQAAAQPDPEPEPAPAEPEPKPEPAPESPTPPEGFVPHGALHQERERRKALEQRIAELEAASKQTQPAAEPDMPDPIMDPKGFAEWQRGQFDAQQKRWRDQEQAQIEQQQRQHRQQIAAQYEQQFMQQTPDYADAVKHLHQSRLTELRMYGMTDEQISATIAQDANSLLDAAMQQGRNPAEVLYQIAKQRGWNTPAAAPAPAVDPAAQIAAQAKAQANATTLSTTGGPPANGDTRWSNSPT